MNYEMRLKGLRDQWIEKVQVSRDAFYNNSKKIQYHKRMVKKLSHLQPKLHKELNKELDLYNEMMV